MYSHKLNYTKKQTARTQIKVCHDIFTFYWWGLIHNNNNIMYKLNSVFYELHWITFISYQFTWIVIYMGLKPKYTCTLYNIFWKNYKIVPHVQMQTADNSKPFSRTILYHFENAWTDILAPFIIVNLKRVLYLNYSKFTIILLFIYFCICFIHYCTSNTYIGIHQM